MRIVDVTGAFWSRIRGDCFGAALRYFVVLPENSILFVTSPVELHILKTFGDQSSV